jgi:hypothetical protein
MRKNEFDKLLKAAVIQDAEEQGKLLSSDDAPIPEEAQARFSVALDRLMPIQQTESNAQRSGSASNRASRRWVGFAVGVPVLAATVLVAGLMLFGGGIKDEKMAEAAQEPSRPTALPAEPMEPAYEPPTGAPLEVGDPEPTYEPEWPSEPISTSEPASTSEPVSTSAPLPEPGGSSFGPAFILNGKELDVYTEHYFIAGTDDDIPLNAFLSSIGSYYVDSPYNKYQVQCYEIEGIRYIYDWESQVFALAEQYDSVVQAAKAQGRTPTNADFRTINLLPDGIEMQAEAWLDHSTLESVLRKMGLDITIEIDREENAIRVTMTKKETTAVPVDPERPDLQLKTQTWQGYDCLIPEGFVSAYESGNEFLAATEQMNDSDLFLMAYSLHTEADLSGWDSDVFSENHLKTLLGTIGAQADYADFIGISSRTVADGIVCYHLYNPSQKVYACLAKVLSDEENCLVMAGMAMGEPGIHEFDSIVSTFVNQSLEKSDDSFEIKDLIGTWTLVDPPSYAKSFTFHLVFESNEKVSLTISQDGKETANAEFTYIFADNTVRLYMESYEVYPDGSIVKEKEEYFLFVSDGVITYDLETDSLFAPNDEGGQSQFIRAE